eukprot:3484544-Pleurochrysis_carterae.AAC.1
MTIHYLAVLQLALQVGGHKIPAAHVHAGASRDRSQGSQGRRTHSCTERLIIVDAGRLRAP